MLHGTKEGRQGPAVCLVISALLKDIVENRYPSEMMRELPEPSIIAVARVRVIVHTMRRPAAAAYQTYCYSSFSCMMNRNSLIINN
jgi:hypothetical protein